MSSDSSEVNDRFLGIVGGGSAVMNVVIFTVLGRIALESVPYGVIVGLFTGAGAGLFIPWFLRFSAVQNEASDDPAVSDAVDRAGGNGRLGVVGLGLELGGITMLAVGFAGAEPDLVTGLLVAVAVALVVPLVAFELVLG